MNELATFRVIERGAIMRAAIDGEIDLSNATDLGAAIVVEVPNEAAGMVLDLTGITFIDSSGIRLLLGLVGRFRWRGQQLAIVAPIGSKVRRVIELAGAGDALELHVTPQEAVGQVERPI
jgi:anti-anti-sigma factor